MNTNTELLTRKCVVCKTSITDTKHICSKCSKVISNSESTTPQTITMPVKRIEKK